MITDKLIYNNTNNNANNITRVISANLEQILQMTHMLSKYLEENKLANAKVKSAKRKAKTMLVCNMNATLAESLCE